MSRFGVTERLEVGRTDRPLAVSADLARVAHLLPATPLALRRRCFLRALVLPTSWHRHSALAALVPVLDADERALALRELERITADEGFWTRTPDWHHFSVAALVRMLQAPAVHGKSWPRDNLVAALFARADMATQDQAVAPWLAALPGMDARQRLESVTALTPWFAARTDGALPRWLISLA